MKYVIFDNGDCVFLPNSVCHNSVSIQIILPVHPVSAGFCRITENKEKKIFKVEAYGESISLQLKSREQDSELLTFALNL